MANDVRHKNETSGDLALFMGKTNSEDVFLEGLPDKEREDVEREARRFKKVLALISFKIHERFKDILSAFRYFDSDH